MPTPSQIPALPDDQDNDLTSDERECREERGPGSLLWIPDCFRVS